MNLTQDYLTQGKGRILEPLPDSLYTAVQTRELDACAIDKFGIPGITLMHRAANACIEVLLARWPETRHLLVYCGSGNNAADGYIVAALMANRGLDVELVVVGDSQKLSTAGQEARAFCLASSAQLVEQAKKITSSSVIVDALLGTGARGELKHPYKLAIDAINASSVPVLAVDIPSGIHADTGTRLAYRTESGETIQAAVRATSTVTFIGLNRGLLTAESKDYCGDLEFTSLGLAADIYTSVAPYGRRLEYSTLYQQLPRREQNAHKNKFGRVLVVGGDAGMGGAVAMAAEAALRCGAGVVTVATHEAHASALLTRCPELMVRGVGATESSVFDAMLEKASLVVVGPGIGKDSWGKQLFERVIDSQLPLVIDADGLNLLASHHPGLSRDNWVLTPHPGEASRLLGGANIQSDRFAAVETLQRNYGGVVVLKGAGSLIAAADSISLCPYGNPGMSSAGMGDILSGVIGGLIAQGCGLELATQLGVVVHSLAADRITAIEGERGLLATDLLLEIRRLLNGL